MLSPEGLAIKKVTIEGFATPTSLRLLHHQPPASALLALTWLEHDTVGLDVRGLTTVSCGFKSYGTREPGSVVGWGGEHGGGGGGCSRCCWGRESSLIVVLAWSSGVEVALEAASREQRDLLARCVELMTSDVLRLEGPMPMQQHQQEEQEHQQEQEQQDAEALDQPPPAATTTAIPAIKNNGSNTTTTAAAAAAAGTHSHASSEATISPNGSFLEQRPLVRGFSAPDAAWRRQRGASTSGRGLAGLATLANRARSGGGGGSLSPTPGYGSGRRRSRGSGSGRWGGGGGGRFDGEAAGELRRRTEEVMGRILLGYDRAKDEARAAAWRVGAIKLKKLLTRAATRQVEGRWARWCEAVRDKNEERQRLDRLQWSLHAKANRDNDLLAWYHSTFCREVYRQRGG
ncbi:unnamed protein product [Laminaria digitata]